ncbi:putative porin [Candidatus Poribacteria bacterium]|nr:putative porin [Candidatus Poribacteria bacterium]
MEKARIYLCAILFLSVLSPQVASANAPIDKEPEGKDAAQLAKQLWGAFFSADARFRQEGIFRDGSPNRYRYRIRLRMSGNFPIHSKVNLGFRMVTGATDDPTTGNVDLDNYFSKKGFNLDRLFLRYVPSQSLTVTVGKFPNPFEHVELAFHNDVQLEGAAQQFRVKDVGFIDQVQLNLGQFVLDEIKSSPDTNLFAGQLFVEGFHFKGLSFGATLYEYRNEDNIAQAVEEGRLGGGDTNTRIGAGTGISSYLSGFRTVEGLAKYEFAIASAPLWLLGAYAQNLLADANDKAYWAEIGVGPIPRLGQLRTLYHYVWVERESMISNYNNADIFNPNAHGHELKFVLPLEKNISIEVLYFIAKNIIASGANSSQHKTRLQLKVKF